MDFLPRAKKSLLEGERESLMAAGVVLIIFLMFVCYVHTAMYLLPPIISTARHGFWDRKRLILKGDEKPSKGGHTTAK